MASLLWKTTVFEVSFNGRDLTGWQGAVDSYEVVQGELVCKPGQGGVLFTNDEYTDFELDIEFLLPPGGNNGLAIRYPGSGQASTDAMCELQIWTTLQKFTAIWIHANTTAQSTEWSRLNEDI